MKCELKNKRLNLKVVLLALIHKPNPALPLWNESLILLVSFHWTTFMNTGLHNWNIGLFCKCDVDYIRKLLYFVESVYWEGDRLQHSPNSNVLATFSVVMYSLQKSKMCIISDRPPPSGDGCNQSAIKDTHKEQSAYITSQISMNRTPNEQLVSVCVLFLQTSIKLTLWFILHYRTVDENSKTIILNIMYLVVLIGQNLGYPRYSLSWPTDGALLVSLTMRLRVQSPRVGHGHRTSVLLALSASPPDIHTSHT